MTRLVRVGLGPGDRPGAALLREVADAMRLAGHHVEDLGPAGAVDAGELDLLLSPRVPAGESGAAETWVPADALASTRSLLSGDAGLEGSVTGVTAVLCADPRTQGLLDRRGHQMASLTRPVWGDLDARVRRLVERAFPAPIRGRESVGPAGRGDRPLRVVVASHDFVFLGGVLAHLRRLPDVEVRIDDVPSFASHDETASAALMEWADVVLCEWVSPLTAWYSHHRPAGVRVVARLHRMEIYNGWVDLVDVAGLDQVICVSPHYAALTLARTGWPASKVTTIPNYVDCDWFDRPKLPGAEYHLGFVGMVPSRKRLDLALDVVERLRERDPRYQLFVKTKMPWQYPWNWADLAERVATAAVLERLTGSRLLREGVVLDPHGADVAAWMRRVGFVLSTSEDESFHLAPVEGMASGAVPVVRDWPGSELVYGERWLHHGVDSMVDTVEEIVTSGGWAERSRLAQEQARRSFDISVVCRLFEQALLPGAR